MSAVTISEESGKQEAGSLTKKVTDTELREHTVYAFDGDERVIFVSKEDLEEQQLLIYEEYSDE